MKRTLALTGNFEKSHPPPIFEASKLGAPSKAAIWFAPTTPAGFVVA
jgi:hypothetical protein